MCSPVTNGVPGRDSSGTMLIYEGVLVARVQVGKKNKTQPKGNHSIKLDLLPTHRPNVAFLISRQNSRIAEVRS